MLMKISSAGKTVDRATARNCFLINQFATPGLGSLMGGRFQAGLGQLFLALAGFGFFLGWFALTLKASYDVAYSDAPAKSYTVLGLTGAGLFAAAWFWALVTSIGLLRQAGAAESPPEPPRAPPPIAGPPA
jgi:hypothetical protein